MVTASAGFVMFVNLIFFSGVHGLRTSGLNVRLLPRSRASHISMYQGLTAEPIAGTSQYLASSAHEQLLLLQGQEEHLPTFLVWGVFIVGGLWLQSIFFRVWERI